LAEAAHPSITVENSSSVEELLKARIAREGLLTYEAFVDTALFDRRFGYYRAGKQDGKDYYTSPEIHAVFGRTVGRCIADACDRLNAFSFTIVELGGASGRFAKDVLSAFTVLLPERYLVVENGRTRKEGCIQWVNSINEVGFQGGLTFVLANEFFDALPFHRVINRNGTMEEVCIGYDRGFFEQTVPLSKPLRAFLERYPLSLPAGHTIEVTTYGLPLVEQLSALLDKACLIVFDYGYHSAEVGRGRFPEGSLLGYKERRVLTDIFRDLGNVDITHHVNFDHLSAMLEDQGWKKEGETEQFRFLFNAGIAEELTVLSLDQRMKAKWLINPEGLGSMISVLGFSKGLPLPLSGFKPNR
jgi:SAM-dependent MidA family methyltransferase